MIHESKQGYSILLENYFVSGLNFKNGIGLELSKDDTPSPTFLIRISNEFELEQFGKIEHHSYVENETLKRSIDLIGLRIKNIFASKNGHLFLSFDNKLEIRINDSPYESWIIYKILSHQKLNSWIIGGVGSTSYFK